MVVLFLPRQPLLSRSAEILVDLTHNVCHFSSRRGKNKRISKKYSLWNSIKVFRNSLIFLYPQNQHVVSPALFDTVDNLQSQRSDYTVSGYPVAVGSV